MTFSPSSSCPLPLQVERGGPHAPPLPQPSDSDSPSSWTRPTSFPSTLPELCSSCASNSWHRPSAITCMQQLHVRHRRSWLPTVRLRTSTAISPQPTIYTTQPAARRFLATRASTTRGGAAASLLWEIMIAQSFGTGSPKSFHAYPRGDFDLESGIPLKPRKPKNSPPDPFMKLRSTTDHFKFFYKIHPVALFLVSLSFGLKILVLFSVYESRFRSIRIGDSEDLVSGSYPLSELWNLVMVAGHSVYTSTNCGNIEGNDSWFLEPYQKNLGQAATFVEHIKDTTGDYTCEECLEYEKKANTELFEQRQSMEKNHIASTLPLCIVRASLGRQGRHHVPPPADHRHRHFDIMGRSGPTRPDPSPVDPTYH